MKRLEVRPLQVVKNAVVFFVTTAHYDKLPHSNGYLGQIRKK